jgi:hypothetical protein
MNTSLIVKVSFIGCICIAVAMILSKTPLTEADPLKSSNYQLVEQSLGASGLVGSQSANFKSDSAIGILGLGNSASTNIQINAGNVTTGDPALTFIVNSDSVSFGQFSAATAATATASFSVVDYTSYGYIVQILGSPPANGAHTLAAMTSSGPSQSGIEQFGINLVANTSPASLGANPDNGQFGFGQAATNYNSSNNYRYISGDTIALGPKSSGQTTYTISYIVNVKALTPGGDYVGGQTLLCTGTY